MTVLSLPSGSCLTPGLVSSCLHTEILHQGHNEGPSISFYLTQCTSRAGVLPRQSLITHSEPAPWIQILTCVMTAPSNFLFYTSYRSAAISSLRVEIPQQQVSSVTASHPYAIMLVLTSSHLYHYLQRGKTGGEHLDSPMLGPWQNKGLNRKCVRCCRLNEIEP